MLLYKQVTTSWTYSIYTRPKVLSPPPQKIYNFLLILFSLKKLKIASLFSAWGGGGAIFAEGWEGSETPKNFLAIFYQIFLQM